MKGRGVYTGGLFGGRGGTRGGRGGPRGGQGVEYVIYYYYHKEPSHTKYQCSF